MFSTLDQCTVAFTKGQSGNPSGRPKGIADKRNRLRRALEADAPDILKTIVAAAKAGDMVAARMVMDRVLPPLRAVDAPQAIRATGDNLSGLADSILREALAGNIAADTARELVTSLAAVAKVKETDDFERRLSSLEVRLNPSHEHEPQTPTCKP